MADRTYIRGTAMTSGNASPKVEKLVGTLLQDISEIKYGEVTLSLRVHDGRVVSVTHTVTESVRESNKFHKEKNNGLV
jgi:hypothetical protein